jgi:hypothetical protein
VGSESVGRDIYAILDWFCKVEFVLVHWMVNFSVNLDIVRSVQLPSEYFDLFVMKLLPDKLYLLIMCLSWWIILDL